MPSSNVYGFHYLLNFAVGISLPAGALFARTGSLNLDLSMLQGNESDQQKVYDFLPHTLQQVYDFPPQTLQPFTNYCGDGRLDLHSIHHHREWMEWHECDRVLHLGSGSGLGEGRDAIEYLQGGYQELALKGCYKVMYKNSLEVKFYEKEKRWMKSLWENWNGEFVRTELQGTSFRDIVLDHEIHENFLLHSTDATVVRDIICSYLSKGGGLFGEGVYLADLPSKADQYAVRDTQFNPGPPALDNDIFYMFVVQTLLGKTARVYCTKGGKAFYRIHDAGGNGPGSLIEPWSNQAGRRFYKDSSTTAPELFHSMKAAVDNANSDDPSTDMLYGRGSCIKKFSEYLVPLESNRSLIRYIMAYTRK